MGFGVRLGRLGRIWDVGFGKQEGPPEGGRYAGWE
jgi:hypothetical protein